MAEFPVVEIKPMLNQTLKKMLVAVVLAAAQTLAEEMLRKQLGRRGRTPR
jgi:hypothetical protein